jgi:hypothetical protein
MAVWAFKDTSPGDSAPTGSGGHDFSRAVKWPTHEAL